MPAVPTIFGGIPLSFITEDGLKQLGLVEDAKRLIDANKAAAAPAAATISWEALLAAAAAIKSFFDGLHSDIDSLSDALNTIVQKIDQVLEEIRNLKVEIRVIVREETTRLMHAELSSLLIPFNSIVRSSSYGQSMSPDQRGDMNDIRRRSLFLTLTLQAYRGNDGYAHWTALSAGITLYIAAARIGNSNIQEIRDNFAPVSSWLSEAVDPAVPLSFPAIAARLSQQADALYSQLSGSVGEWAVWPSSRPVGPGVITRTILFVVVYGNVDVGFTASPTQERDVLDGYKPPRTWYSEGHRYDASRNALIAYLATETTLYQELRSASRQLSAIAEQIAAAKQELNTILE